MPQNFVGSCREQGFLLPPDVREWLAGDHLAWFVIDAVGELDLSALYRAYRADGHGRAAYDPSVMVSVILYAFATGVRSSRAIERHCRQDVAYRVITGNVIPDHATIARFICRHERALAELFDEVLRLCGEAGLVSSGVVAIDGTRVAGNCSGEANRGFEEIAQEILAEAKATDAAEDAQFGERRGDELPEPLRTAEGRRAFLRQARKKLTDDEAEAGQVSDGSDRPDGSEREYEFDPERIVTRSSGRRGWLRDADRQLEQQRWEDPDEIARSRAARLLLAAERAEDDLAAERAANEAYAAWRQRGIAADGSRRMASGTTKPYQVPEVPPGKVNVTDPDSKPLPVSFGFVQGYNAQAAVNEQQIVLAAEITNKSTDFSQLAPMVQAILRELERAGIEQRPETVVADAGYWNERHIDEVVADKHIQVLVAPDKSSRGTPRKTWNGPRYDWMRAVLRSEPGRERYRKRKQTVEPLFGHTKHNKGVTRFLRRGRIKVRTEWRLHMMAHNLTKLYKHQIAALAA